MYSMCICVSWGISSLTITILQYYRSLNVKSSSIQSIVVVKRIPSYETMDCVAVMISDLDRGLLYDTAVTL